MAIVNAKKLWIHPLLLTEETKETLRRPDEKRRRGLLPSAALGLV